MTGLILARSVTVDAYGDVFIANPSYNGSVVEVQPNGTQTIVASELDPDAQGLAVDDSGDVFIADAGDNQVVEVNADGTQTTVAAGLDVPTGVALDAGGDMFIADNGGNSVVEVEAGVQVTVNAPSLVVNTLADPANATNGVTSLRAPANAALLGGNQTVTFAAGLTGSIVLNSGLAIASNVTIAGPGASSLTVAGGGPSSNFSVFQLIVE